MLVIWHNSKPVSNGTVFYISQGTSGLFIVSKRTFDCFFFFFFNSYYVKNTSHALTCVCVCEHACMYRGMGWGGGTTSTRHCSIVNYIYDDDGIKKKY